MTCGIVDLGSNTIRLSVYRLEGREAKLLFHKKTMAGLAGYVGKKKALSEEGILTACRVLSDYRALLDNLGVERLHVFATASLRNISNAGQTLGTILDRTGLTVEVLSGEEEAALSFKGAVRPGGVASGLLADIGGGSVELVTYENMEITSSRTIPVGSLSLYAKYVGGIFPTKEQRWDMEDFAKRKLKPKEPGAAPPQCEYLCGVGGTVRAVSKLAGHVLPNRDPDSRALKAEELEELYGRLKKGDWKSLQQILRTAPDRVHTILPGLILLRAVVKAYHVKTMLVSTTGVREGYLMDRVMGEG